MKILNRFNGNVIFECDAKTMKLTVVAALSSLANLSRADLSGADLSWANLYGADLSGADLSGANLYGANLSGANLSWANLYGADLSRANLYGADLSGADLSGANLSRANLSGANLSWANLSGANLYGEKITKSPLQIGRGFKWLICITEKHIQIGCQVHMAEEWFAFSDEHIKAMHEDALPFWNENKAIIKALWEHHVKDKQC